MALEDGFECGNAPEVAFARVRMEGCDGYWFFDPAQDADGAGTAGNHNGATAGETSARVWVLARGREVLARWTVPASVEATDVLATTFDVRLGALVWLSRGGPHEGGTADSDEAALASSLLLDASALGAAEVLAPQGSRVALEVALWPTPAVQVDRTRIAPPFVWSAYVCQAPEAAGTLAGRGTQRGVAQLALLLERTQSAGVGEVADPLWSQGAVTRVDETGWPEFAELSADARAACVPVIPSL